MRYLLDRREDIFASLFTGAIGVFIIVEGLGYRMGALQSMGPGYFPVIIGVFMVLLALIMAGTAKRGEASRTIDRDQLRGMAFVAAAFLTFAFTIESLGMIPALGAAVFLSSLANRRTNLVTALMLSVVTAIACALIFRVGLGLQIEAF